jgi:hypothetical protein
VDVAAACRNNRGMMLNRGMILADLVVFESSTARILVYVTLVLAGLVLLFAGYKIGRWLATATYKGEIAKSQKDLFTTQQGFKQLYEREIAELQQAVTASKAENDSLKSRVEEYRKKAAGFGGLFSSGGKKADAMYALLLENEALEEALHKQNGKLAAERQDGLQESLRNISYRRTLMSQLMNDNRIKDYVREILEDEGRLPAPAANTTARLPAPATDAR